MEYQITEEQNGWLLRRFLREKLGLSRGTLTYLKQKEGGIRLNGVSVTVRAQLSTGDLVSLAVEDGEAEENNNLVPTDLPLAILAENEYYTAVNKPPHMPTHPTHGHYEDTLANGLAFRYRSLRVPFVCRPVNRLDRDTSGIVLVARNRASAALLSDAMAKGEFQKTYLALAVGETDKAGVIIAPIKRCGDSIIKRTVCADGEGQYAETRYESVAHGGGLTLFLVTPKTGRTHQIRVHLASIGFPLLGDTLYGDEEGSPLLARQGLHCFSLTFPHPATGERVMVNAPLPEDMVEVIKKAMPGVEKRFG